MQPDLFLGEAHQPAGELAITPAWLTQAILRHVPVPLRPKVRILDPGAGTGAIAREVEGWIEAHDRKPEVTAVDVVPERRIAWPLRWSTAISDLFLWAQAAQRRRARWDLIVTNPPFSRWYDWVDACLPLLAAQGVLVAIGPLAYLGGVGHSVWWRERLPQLVMLSARRPRGMGWNNTREIMATMWRRSVVPGDSRFVWLG